MSEENKDRTANLSGTDETARHKSRPVVSVVVPCFNEAESVPLFYKEIVKIASDSLPCSCEFVFVDDGSKDDTLREIRELAKMDGRVRYISFSRNFGKESAIYAGLASSRGEYVALMDADMQDPPSMLPEMYRILQTGDYDNVATRRVSREGEPVVRSLFARLFYKIINRISDTEIPDGARDFRMMSRKMVEAVLRTAEYNRFSKGLFGWVGFRTYWLPYENVERVAGQTKWNFWKLFKYALEGLVNFSLAPLYASVFFGSLCVLAAFLWMIVLVYKKITLGDYNVSGWTSTICVILAIGGIQLLSIGILGQYIAKIFLETKHRPLYIVAETNIRERNRNEIVDGAGNSLGNIKGTAN